MFDELLNRYTKTQLLILQTIYQSRKITRAELTKATGFQLLTVTKAVSGLLEDGLNRLRPGLVLWRNRA